MPIYVFYGLMILAFSEQPIFYREFRLFIIQFADLNFFTTQSTFPLYYIIRTVN